jgi:hypothetical protein
MRASASGRVDRMRGVHVASDRATLMPPLFRADVLELLPPGLRRLAVTNLVSFDHRSWEA